MYANDWSGVDPKQLVGCIHAVSVAKTTVCRTGEKAILKAFLRRKTVAIPFSNQRRAKGGGVETHCALVSGA